MVRVLPSDWNKPCSNNLEHWFGMGGLLAAGMVVDLVEKFCNNFDKVPVASDIWIVVVGTLVIVVVYVLENGKIVVLVLVFSVMVIGSCEGWLMSDSCSFCCGILDFEQDKSNGFSSWIQLLDFKSSEEEEEDLLLLFLKSGFGDCSILHW